MTEEKGFKTRPTCNIIDGCTEDAIMVICGKLCCGTHLIKLNEQQKKVELETIQGLLNAN